VNLTRVLSGAQLTDKGHGKYSVTIANPLDVSYEGLPPAGTTLPGAQGPGVFLSIQPDGGVQARKEAGAWESCTISGNLLIFSPVLEGVFVLPFATFKA